MQVVITWIFIVLSLGTLRLIFHWVPYFMLRCTHFKCPLDKAETVLLIEKFQGKHTSYYVKKLKVLTAQEVVLVLLSFFDLFEDTKSTL